MQASPLLTCISCSRRSKFVERYSSRCDRTATLFVSLNEIFLAGIGRFLDRWLGRQGSLVLLLADRHPDPAALYREIGRQLAHSSCDVPNGFPQFF